MMNFSFLQQQTEYALFALPGGSQPPSPREVARSAGGSQPPSPREVARSAGGSQPPSLREVARDSVTEGVSLLL